MKASLSATIRIRSLAWSSSATIHTCDWQPLTLLASSPMLLGERRQLAAEIEHVLDLLAPVVEQLEVLGDQPLFLGDGRCLKS